jgi:hypothetical protein
MRVLGEWLEEPTELEGSEITWGLVGSEENFEFFSGRCHH